MKSKLEWQDVAIRGVMVVGGGIAAVLFVMQGNADALAPLAFGGALAAILVRGFASPEEL
ncbi:MAG: hypothetical protein ACYC7A_01510 [Thermoanaerobaculia bacterium]